MKNYPVIDAFLAPLVYPSAWLLKKIRGAGVQNFPRCKTALMKIGVFPVRDHYYEPQFKFGAEPLLSDDRVLPGIDWNVKGQLELLYQFDAIAGLTDIPMDKPAKLAFYQNNGSFESGDAEYWYQLIHYIRPKRIFEVGSGNSTLMALRALKHLKEIDTKYQCMHVCIEPYEMPWLEETGVIVIRKRIEDLEPGFFAELEENDILFIDSSHIIRPHGDVVFEYLQLLPTLAKGVIVHLHDIFSPRNYPAQWVKDEVRFWNEQYLLEAFLTHNTSWKIIGALNFLQHHHYDALKNIAPYLTFDREPGSFYMQKL